MMYRAIPDKPHKAKLNNLNHLQQHNPNISD